MARNLALKQNTEPADAEYPFGRIRNNPGNNTGTPVNEEVYGDFHQFFAKMFAQSGLVYNNIPDNAYDGFQYFQALLNVINTEASGSFQVPSYTAPFIDNPSQPIRFRMENNKRVHLRGKVYTSAGELGQTTAKTIFTLPAGFRPQHDIFINGAIDITTVGLFILLEIKANGSVILHGEFTAFNDHSVEINFTFSIDD